jgi:hypothetical protein
MFRLLSTCIAATSLVAFSAVAKPPSAADLVRARSMMFGAEHVDQRTGQVDQGLVIFSWLTNATLAASVKGHVILLDTFVHRPETVPARTPSSSKISSVSRPRRPLSGTVTAITPTTPPGSAANSEFRSSPQRRPVRI